MLELNSCWVSLPFPPLGCPCACSARSAQDTRSPRSRFARFWGAAKALGGGDLGLEDAGGGVSKQLSAGELGELATEESPDETPSLQHKVENSDSVR